MFGLIFALAAALATAGYRVATKHLMKTHSPYAFALLVNLFGLFLTIPLIWTDFSWERMPHTVWPWLIVAASTTLWCIIMVMAFSSFKHIAISRREQISQVEILFVILLGILFLGESMTLFKGIGALLVIAGVIIAATGKTPIHSGWRSKGVKLTVGAAALYALVAIVDKEALRYFPTGIYTFLLYFLPFLVLLAFLGVRNNFKETKHMIDKKGWMVIVATLLSVSSYYLGLRAYALTDATNVYPIMKLAMVFAVVGGLIFFREERRQIMRKIIAVIIVLFGVMMIAAGSMF